MTRWLCLILCSMLVGCSAGEKVLSLGMYQDQEFGGKIARSYEDSVEWWPEDVRPHPDAPNVLILLLDDVGFAQLAGSFGGLIETPNIDRLAANGLRFNNFHTTALCSPSRASLMAGRYQTNGILFLIIKTRSIDVTQAPKKIIEKEIQKLQKDFEILEKIDLRPYDKDHAMIISKIKN